MIQTSIVINLLLHKVYFIYPRMTSVLYWTEGHTTRQNVFFYSPKTEGRRAIKNTFYQAACSEVKHNALAFRRFIKISYEEVHTIIY